MIRSVRLACLIILLLFLSACGGGSRAPVAGVDPATPSQSCDDSCVDTPTASRPLKCAEMQKLYLDENGKPWNVQDE